MAEVVCGACDGTGDIPTEYAAVGPIRDGRGGYSVPPGKVGSLVVPMPCGYCDATGWIQLYARKTQKS